jgi:hypothetical protein
VFIDHINSNPFDNRSINLRRSNAQLNGQNKAKRNGTSSKYIGVNYDHTAWATKVTNNNKVKHLGRTQNEEYAARYRDLYIMKHWPDSHYKMNFEWNNEQVTYWREYLIGKLSRYEL